MCVTDEDHLLTNAPPTVRPTAFIRECGMKFNANAAAVTIDGLLVDKYEKVSALSLDLSLSEGTRIHITIPKSTGWTAGPKFHVDMTTPNGETHYFETHLNAKWLSKPLLQSLIVPALAKTKMKHVPPTEVKAEMDAEAGGVVPGGHS